MLYQQPRQQQFGYLWAQDEREINTYLSNERLYDIIWAKLNLCFNWLWHLVNTTSKQLSKALWAGQTEGEGLKISDLVFSFLNVPTGCGHDL